jgi:hypothetical protein
LGFIPDVKDNVAGKLRRYTTRTLVGFHLTIPYSTNQPINYLTAFSLAGLSPFFDCRLCFQLHELYELNELHEPNRPNELHTGCCCPYPDSVLAIGLSGAHDDCCNVNRLAFPVKRENGAVTPHALAQCAFELSAFDWANTAACGVSSHLFNRLRYLLATILRQATELLGRLTGEPTGPAHALAHSIQRTRHS